jgi:hypothetical protein
MKRLEKRPRSNAMEIQLMDRIYLQYLGVCSLLARVSRGEVMIKRLWNLLFPVYRACPVCGAGYAPRRHALLCVQCCLR